MIRCYLTVRCDKCGAETAPYLPENLGARTRDWHRWNGQDVCPACLGVALEVVE